MDTTPPSAPTDEQNAPPPPPPPPGPRTTRDEVRDLGRLRRSRTDKKVAGVAGGLGRHLDVDPVVLRVAFVVLTFFGGAGLIVYAAGWLFLPHEDGTEAVIGLEERTRVVALGLVGVLAAAALLADLSGAGGWFGWQLLVVAVVLAFLFTRRREGGGAVPPTPPTPATAPPPPPTAYGTAYGTAYVPPAPWTPPPPPPPNPRKRGPVLFWFTVALVALAEGLLGIADTAGAGVPGPAYPALALGIVGAMLVLGAFFGRAGGLIAVGLLAVPVLGVAMLVHEVDPDPRTERPLTAAEVADDYGLGWGELVLDLTEVDDLEELDGRTVTVDIDGGRIEVVVPEGLTVRAEGTVEGPGALQLFDGEENGGISVSDAVTLDAGAESPELTLDLRAGFGEILTRSE